MKEAELQEAIIGAAHVFGWHVAHFRPLRTKHGWRTPVAADGKGFPDLFMCRPGDRMIFAELKVNYRKLEPDQEKWRDWILESGGEWYHWTEKEWLSGEIDKILR